MLKEGVYNYAYYDRLYTHIDQERLLYTNWQTGSPNHITSSNTDKCVRMNWRYRFLRI